MHLAVVVVVVVLVDEVIEVEEEDSEEAAHAVVCTFGLFDLLILECLTDILQFSYPAGRGRGGGDRGGRGGGRGASRGGRGGRGGGRGGAKGGSNTVLEPHRHAGVFIAKGKDHMLVTKNLVPGESVYGEKRISIESGVEGTKTEYRVWNPFRSKLAAGVLGGLDDIFIKPGGKVLYLGAASGTSVSHVADIVGPVCLLFYYRLRLCITVCRRVLSMPLNFQHGRVVT